MHSVMARRLIAGGGVFIMILAACSASGTGG